MSEQFKYTLSAVSIMKYEEPYVAEWVAYHKIVGIEHFYIYDNGDTCTLKDVLKPYIEEGTVTVTHFPGELQMFPAFNDAIREYKNESKYIAFFDADEFLFPFGEDVNVADLVDFLFDKFGEIKMGSLGVNWSIFDDGGHIKKPEGLVIENYVGRTDASANQHIKSIVNPRKVRSFVNPHFADLEPGYRCFSEDGHVIEGPFHPEGKRRFLRFNHYFLKSEEEYAFRMTRKKADVKLTEIQLAIHLENAKKEIGASKRTFDNSMTRYTQKVKKELTSKGYDWRTGQLIDSSKGEEQ